jgi:predicted component of type VI protein secretion system
MKLSLVVLTPGQQQGKALEIKLPQFLVGRDPQCHLRPASPLISKRHCAVLQRDGKVLLRDFDSTNGTFVNEQPVKGEVELKNADRLKIGPILLEVRIDASAPAAPEVAMAPASPPVNRPTPAPPTRAVGAKAAPKPASATPAPPTKAPAAESAAAAETPPPATEKPAETATAKEPAKAAPAKSSSTEDDDIAAMLLSIGSDTDTAGLTSDAAVPEGSTVHDLAVPQEILNAPGPDGATKESKEAKTKAVNANTSVAAKSILEKYMRRPRS